MNIQEARQIVVENDDIVAIVNDAAERASKGSWGEPAYHAAMEELAILLGEMVVEAVRNGAASPIDAIDKLPASLHWFARSDLVSRRSIYIESAKTEFAKQRTRERAARKKALTAREAKADPNVVWMLRVHKERLAQLYNELRDAPTYLKRNRAWRAGLLKSKIAELEKRLLR